MKKKDKREIKNKGNRRVMVVILALMIVAAIALSIIIYKNLTVVEETEENASIESECNSYVIDLDSGSCYNNNTKELYLNFKRASETGLSTTLKAIDIAIPTDNYAAKFTLMENFPHPAIRECNGSYNSAISLPESNNSKIYAINISATYLGGVDFITKAPVIAKGTQVYSCPHLYTYTINLCQSQQVCEIVKKEKQDSQIVQQVQTSKSCTENDGGKIFEIPGSVNVTTDKYNLEWKDYCDNNYLVEYFCENNDVKSEYLLCPYGCYDGLCQPKHTCTDSDNGINATVLGRIEELYKESDNSGVDFCWEEGGHFLKEYYCDGTEARQWDVYCYDRCENGVCIGSYNF